MNRNEILSILREYKEQTADHYALTALGIFGSVARDEARDDSDVDIVVKTDRPNLITLSRMRIEIEEAVHRHVDIVHYREKMNPLLKRRIDKEAVYV